MRERISSKVASSTGFRSATKHNSEEAKNILNRLEQENNVDESSYSMFIYTKKHAEKDIHPSWVRCFGKWIQVHKTCCFAALEGMTCRM